MFHANAKPVITVFWSKHASTIYRLPPTTVMLKANSLATTKMRTVKNEETVALRNCNYRVVFGEGKWKSAELLTNFIRKGGYEQAGNGVIKRT